MDGDAFFQSIRNGWIPPWQPEAHRQNETVIQAIGAAAAQFAAGGYRVVVDGVIWPWFLEVFLDQFDVPVGYVVLRPSAEEAMKRAVARDESKLVDPEPISLIYDSFSGLGDYERFVVDSTGLDVVETAETVLARMFANQQVLNG